MRDMTKSVTESPAIPGDRTHNGADTRKSRKLTDKLESHTTETAYALSDTTVSIGGRVVAVERSRSRLVVRNADGTINRQDTLALADWYRTHTASKRKGHNA